MRFLMLPALVLSLLAIPAAASACGMEMEIDRKHTLVAKKATKLDKIVLTEADKAANLKALLGAIDAVMEAEPVTATATAPDAAPAIAPAIDPEPAPATATPPPSTKIARK